MNDEEINLKIAELCGWTNIILYMGVCLMGEHSELSCLHPIPNYCSDLNAAVGAIKQCLHGYIFELSNVSEDDALQVGNRLHWTARLYVKEDDKISTCTSTASLAICISILRVKDEWDE